MIGETNELVPIEENVKVYEELMSIYLSVSRQLEGDYKRIAEFPKTSFRMNLRMNEHCASICRKKTGLQNTTGIFFNLEKLRKTGFSSNLSIV